VNALQGLGIDPREVALVGAEGGWGNYVGVLSDESLNRVYNAVDFVLMCSIYEGLGLPACEAMATGVIPVICADLPTREEFFPAAAFPEYLKVQPTPESVAAFIARYLNSPPAIMENMKNRLHQHYLDHWQARLSPAGVAGAILKVYNSLS
jgi:glycosyltransferase involved in cell wall biosynthesis